MRPPLAFPALLNPWLHLLFILAAGAAAYFFQLPESITAGIVIIYAIIVTALHPVNGGALLLLSVPFFFDVGYRPYFFLLDVFAALAIISALFHGWLRGGISLPLRFLTAGFALASALSLPVDGKEAIYELWAYPFGDLAKVWVYSHPGLQVHYLRVLFNTLIDIGALAALFNFWPRDNHRYHRRLADTAVALALLIALAALAMFYRLVPTGSTYMGLSLVGSHIGFGITGFTYNRAFLSSYFVLVIALAVPYVYLAMRERAHFRMILYAFSMSVLCYLIIRSGQRASIMFLTMLIVIGPSLYFIFNAAVPWRNFSIGVFILLPAAVIALLQQFDTTLYDNAHLMRFALSSDDSRRILWGICWGMFEDYPLLGYGLGSYFRAFPDYFPLDDSQWSAFAPLRVNAHSLYFQLLAERGGLGLALFLAMAFMTLFTGARGVRRDESPHSRATALSFLLMLAAWLGLAVFNNLLHIRSIDLLFWTTAGALLAYGKMYVPRIDFPRWLRRAAVIAVPLLLAAQVSFAYHKPVREDYQVGMYNWERQPNGEYARWTLRRAVAKVPIDGQGRVAVKVSAPLPGADTNPQEATLRLGDEERRVTLPGGAWREVVFNKPADRMLYIETKYLFNPKAQGISGDDRDLGVYVSYQP